MFGGAFDKATGLLDKRFVLDLLLPCLVFWAGLTALATRGTGWPPLAARWRALMGFEQALVVGGAVTGVMVSAYVAAGLLTTMTRLWEGYWPVRVGVARQARRWARLDATGGYERRFYEYPVSKDELLPTRLGNVLRAAESYPGDEERYGVDAVFFWPRLYLVLPAEAREQVDGCRAAMDRMVLLASLALLFPPAALVLVPLAGVGWPAWVWASAAALVMCVLAYRSAVQAALVFGDTVRACFDLYRRTLLTQLGLVLPGTLEEERALWRSLQQQLYRRGADHPELIRLAAGTSPPPPATAAPDD